MKAFLSCVCPFVLIFCKQPMINLHWLQMFTENGFHCFVGRGVGVHTLCTGVCSSSAALPFCTPCCAPALCVSTICNHTVPDSYLSGLGKGKPSQQSPSLCALCVWMHPAPSLPTGKAAGVANTPDSLGTNQTDTHLHACPGTVHLYLCQTSLASASGSPLLFRVLQ